MPHISTTTTRNRFEREIPGGREVEATTEKLTDIVVPWVTIRREFDGTTGELVKQYPIDHWEVRTKLFERNTELLREFFDSNDIKAGDSINIQGQGSFSAYLELLGLQFGFRISNSKDFEIANSIPKPIAGDWQTLSISRLGETERAKELIENNLPRLIVAENQEQLERALSAVKRAENLGLRIKPVIVIPEKLKLPERSKNPQLRKADSGRRSESIKTPDEVKVSRYRGALIVSVKEPTSKTNQTTNGAKLGSEQNLSELKIPSAATWRVKASRVVGQDTKVTRAIAKKESEAIPSTLKDSKHRNLISTPLSRAETRAEKVLSGIKTDSLTMIAATNIKAALETSRHSLNKFHRFSRLGESVSTWKISKPVAVANGMRSVGKLAWRDVRVEKDSNLAEKKGRTSRAGIEVLNRSQEISRAKTPQVQKVTSARKLVTNPVKIATPNQITAAKSTLVRGAVDQRQAYENNRRSIFSKSDLKSLLVQPHYKGNDTQAGSKVDHRTSGNTSDSIRHRESRRQVDPTASDRIQSGQSRIRKGAQIASKTESVSSSNVRNASQSTSVDKSSIEIRGSTTVELNTDVLSTVELSSSRFGHECRHIILQERQATNAASKKLSLANVPAVNKSLPSQPKEIIPRLTRKPIAIDPNRLVKTFQAI